MGSRPLASPFAAALKAKQAPKADASKGPSGPMLGVVHGAGGQQGSRQCFGQYKVTYAEFSAKASVAESKEVWLGPAAC